VEADRSSERQLNIKADLALKAVDSSRHGSDSESKAQHKAAWPRSYEIDISSNWRDKGLTGLVRQYRAEQVAKQLVSSRCWRGMHQRSLATVIEEDWKEFARSSEEQLNGSLGSKQKQVQTVYRTGQSMAGKTEAALYRCLSGLVAGPDGKTKTKDLLSPPPPISILPNLLAWDAKPGWSASSRPALPLPRAVITSLLP